MADRTFIDPLIHSERVGRAQLGAFIAILWLLVVGVWCWWAAMGTGLRAPLMASSALAAGMGVGYYILKRTRQVLKAFVWFRVGDEGLVSMTPAGEVRVSWPEVREVQVGFRAARGRNADILILTAKGSLRAFQRWTDQAEPLPEPVLFSGGARMVGPDGRVTPVDPEHSPLLAALRERLPPEKIKPGVMLSL
jgi:hypothetical protein